MAANTAKKGNMPECACTAALNCKQKRLMTVGLLLLDVVNKCEKYPDEDTDVFGIEGHWQCGGNASNSATVMRHLGMTVEYLGMVSSAPAFNFLIQDRVNRGIIISNCSYVPNDPGISSVWLSLATGSRTIVESNRTFPIFKYEHFRGIDLSPYYWINFEARNCAENIQMIADVVRYNEKASEKIQISLDVEISDPDSVKMCALVDYVVLSRSYADFMGWKGGPKEAAMGLRNAIKPHPEFGIRKSVIIIPYGSKGAGYLDENGNFEMMPPFAPSKIVDSLGAGDTFMAGLLYGLAYKKLSIRDAITIGNRCAGYKLGYTGYDCMADFAKQLQS